MTQAEGSDMPATLLVGASGFLGRAVVAQMPPLRPLLPTYRSIPVPGGLRLDLLADDLETSLTGHLVATVIMAAAIETEPWADLEPAMQRFVRWCDDRRLVYLSSDALFDGARGHYSERDIPTPRTPYGANLDRCEALVRRHCPNHCIIRPSYIYGFSAGELDGRLASTSASLLAGDEVTYFSDMYKSPLGVGQVAGAVVTLHDSAFVGTVHVAGPRLSVYDFHHQAMTALGIPTDRLSAEPMPWADGLARDTSLNTTLWTRLTGSRPLSVAATLTHR